MHRLDAFRDYAIGLFRIVVGFLFACHGVKSLFGVLGADGPTPFGVWPYWWAAAIELTVGGLVLLGVGTRLAALLGSGSMAYAFFVVHLPDALLPIQNGGEMAALFCWSLLLLAVVGPGRFALGNAIAAHRTGATSRSELSRPSTTLA